MRRFSDSERRRQVAREHLRRLWALLDYSRRRGWREGERRAGRALAAAWRQYLATLPDALSASFAEIWPSPGQVHDLTRRQPHARIQRVGGCECRFCRGQG